VFEGPDDQRPLRQLGAASLGDTGAFNEVTAIYRGEQGQGGWRLDLRLVNLRAIDPSATSPVVLPNRAEVAAREKKQLERAAAQRRDFERSMRNVMRRFSDQVLQARPDNRQNQVIIPPLPQGAMLLVQDVVSNVIFKGYETRVRLLLKGKDARGASIPRLVPTYLDPAIMDGPGALTYPASVAAWALVLGRTLKFPDIKEETTRAEDHEWLRRNKKFKELWDALGALREDAVVANSTEAAERYLALQTTLDAISKASNGQSGVTVPGKDIYQSAPGGSPPSSFPAFICVPYPMRPPGGSLPENPEIAVLDVGVRPVENPDFEDSSLSSVVPFNPFTDERVEMLETLTELIGVMLVTSDALGKPRGIWYDRP
jgi:hypothetical protein